MYKLLRLIILAALVFGSLSVQPVQAKTNTIDTNSTLHHAGRHPFHPQWL